MHRDTQPLLNGVPSVEWDRFDLWISPDRTRRLGFRTSGTACVLELTGNADVPTLRIEFTIDELRAVARGGRTCGGGEAITCALGRWEDVVEFRVRADIIADCQVPLRRYVVLIAWLGQKARANRPRIKRIVAAAKKRV